ncbi:carboxymuconolactone decarboxylase family protein [Actinomycetota bacterium]
MNTNGEESEAIAAVRARRGFVLPVHRLLDRLDPEILRRYDSLASYVIRDESVKALDLKTRYLVMVGVTTAVNGDAEGIEWSAAGAIRHGATEEEVLEAMVLAMLPAGVPALEKAAHVWDGLASGTGVIGLQLEENRVEETP